jgi:hypothetical protein
MAVCRERSESARTKRDGRRARSDVSLGMWCDACCGPSGRSGFYTAPLAVLISEGIPRDTLRVAVDPFAEAEIRYRFLVEERRSGGLQPRAFRVAVRDLAVLDSEGRRWMLGPEDGIWYRRESERWLQADPPRRLVCGSCGHHNLGRHSFCVECGQRLAR